MTRHASRADPITSHEAAAKAEASGLIENDSAILLRLLRDCPGSTIPEMAATLFAETSGSLEYCRQRLGRRTGDLLKAGLAYPKGKRDGCQCWFPGKEPAQPGEGEQRALFEPEPRPWVTD